MICTVTNHSEDISLSPGEIMFVCQCDDGRRVLISAEFAERYRLPEILSQIGVQLANATIEVPKLNTWI
jgi:hypothetical protein